MPCRSTYVQREKQIIYILYSNIESALDVDVNKKTFEQHDLENISWISHLSYLDPNADIRDCTAQG
jgi:hypothetical protein